jgi:hypothetical protein
MISSYRLSLAVSHLLRLGQGKDRLSARRRPVICMTVKECIEEHTRTYLGQSPPCDDPI